MTERKYWVLTLGRRWSVAYRCQGETFHHSAYDTEEEAQRKADELNSKPDGGRPVTIYQGRNNKSAELSAELTGPLGLLDELADLAVDDNPLIVSIGDDSPRLVVIDWFQYQLMVDRLDQLSELVDYADDVIRRTPDYD